MTDAGYQLKAGTVLLLEGENGAGKSTLFKILAGIIKPDNYRQIWLNHTIAYKSTSYRSQIHYLGHTPAFYTDLSAVNNLNFFAAVNGIPDAEARMMDLLIRARLDRRRDESVNRYSRGMVQRLAICSAFMKPAAVYLLDEPFTALDRVSENFVKDLIEEARIAGSCCILTTHDPQKVTDIISHRALLHNGVIEER